MKTSPHVGRTARYLAQYWKNAYTIRARGLTMQPVTSNKVLELVAFSKWQEQDWSFNFRANHALALNQIISRNSDEIRAIVKEARDSSEDRDIRQGVKWVRTLSLAKQ